MWQLNGPASSRLGQKLGETWVQNPRCFIVTNFVEWEWSLRSVNWISGGPEAWVQMRSTSIVQRPSAEKDKKRALQEKTLEKLKVKWSFKHLDVLQTSNKSAESPDTLDKDIGMNSYLQDILKCKASKRKKLFYWQCNNNIQFALCKRRPCQWRVKSHSH